MTIRQILTTGATTAALFGWTLARPAPVAAHCDSMDGPVVTAARVALAQGKVELVLGWVRAQDEAQIRTAFARTLEVRRSGGEAEALADLWFFETLVRIHREGEGEPYTGLKPAGQETASGIAAADQALQAGSVETLAPEIAEHVAHAVRERFQRVQALANYDPRDVDAARAWVHAYVEYIHFVEGIVEAAEGAGHAGGGTLMTTMTQSLRDEHKELLPHLEHILTLADLITEGANPELVERVGRIHRFLAEDLLHHAHVEEQALYPVVARVMGAPEATATMSRDHVEIGRLVEELGTLHGQLRGGAISGSQANEIRRLLYGLLAVVRLHFLKEEEVYLPILDAKLTDAEGAALVEALREAGAAV